MVEVNFTGGGAVIKDCRRSERREAARRQTATFTRRYEQRQKKIERPLRETKCQRVQGGGLRSQFCQKYMYTVKRGELKSGMS